jgi:hypothetical protein
MKIKIIAQNLPTRVVEMTTEDVIQRQIENPEEIVMFWVPSLKKWVTIPLD